MRTGFHDRTGPFPKQLLRARGSRIFEKIDRYSHLLDEKPPIVLGHRAYVGGKYYGYHRFEPLGLSRSLVADAVHGAFTNEDPEITQSKADNAVAHISRNLDSFPFLMTFSNLSSVTQGDPTTMAQRFIGHLVSGFIPSALGNVAQAEDRTIRRPTTIAEFAESKIPGMTQRVPALIDVTGQPMMRPVSELGGANPFPVSPAANDPAASELARLSIATPAPIKQVSAKGHAFAITPDESQAMLEKEGQEIHEVLSKFVAHPAWTTLNDPLKVEVIKRVRANIVKDRILALARMRAAQRNSPWSLAALPANTCSVGTFTVRRRPSFGECSSPPSNSPLASELHPRCAVPYIHG